MNKHAKAAAAFINDNDRTNWHDESLWWIRSKRDKAVTQIPEWEYLREMASQIKSHTLSHLGDYLKQFEMNAAQNGIEVHWALDAEEHNRIVLSILQQNKVGKLVKSKSMLTEECHLNPWLEKNGIQVVDTDLGEWVVQLAKEPPSHIVMPCIHWKKEEIGELFHQHIGTQKGAVDPQYLVSAARTFLRTKFMEADAAITGVNFAIAETGGFVVCTNEGNADMGAHLSKIHIACMGIEKIIPKAMHLGVFLRLLARSATGQPITTYSSHFHKPRPDQQMHIVIVDNGRTRQLGREDFRNSLKCIRCAACFNTCPVYRKSGGHSYHTTVAGPIGSVLAPNINMREFADLPFASTLCGSCTNVCPVKINIHEQLWKWRQVLVTEGYVDSSKRIGITVMATILSHPWLYRFCGKAMRWFLRYLPFLVNNRWNVWSNQRDMPIAPKQSFRTLYQKKYKANEHQR